MSFTSIMNPIAGSGRAAEAGEMTMIALLVGLLGTAFYGWFRTRKYRPDKD